MSLSKGWASSLVPQRFRSKALFTLNGEEACLACPRCLILAGQTQETILVTVRHLSSLPSSYILTSGIQDAWCVCERVAGRMQALERWNSIPVIRMLSPLPVCQHSRLLSPDHVRFASGNSLSGFYTYEELRPYFNFGLAEIESNGNLTFSVINTDNEVQPRK